MKKVTELTEELARPLAEAEGCSIWDVEYVREGGVWILRVLLDCPEGVSINQCEAVSRPLSDKLDELDPIEGSYTLEVGSPGADRALKKPEHFAACAGQEVEVRLYRPVDGQKSFHGVLKSWEDGVTLDCGGTERHFTSKELALVRLWIDF